MGFEKKPYRGKNLNSKNVAFIGLVFASLIWAVAGVAYKLFISLGYTFAFLFLVTRFFKFTSVWAIGGIRETRHQPIKDRKELALILLNGIFSVATPVFFVLSLSHTSLSNAYFLNYTMPAWVLVLSVLLLGEKISSKKIIGVLLTIAGIIAIARPVDVFSISPGIVFGILSALSFSGDVITARGLKNYSYHTVTIYTNLFQFLVFVPLVFTAGFLPASLDFISTGAIVLMGALLGIASYAYYFALEKIEASSAAIISLLELFFAAILGYLIFSEVPASPEVLGYGLILAAIVMLVLRKPSIENFERLLHFHRKH